MFVSFSFHFARLLVNLVLDSVDCSACTSANGLTRVLGDFLVGFTADGMRRLGHFLSNVVVPKRRTHQYELVQIT